VEEDDPKPPKPVAPPEVRAEVPPVPAPEDGVPPPADPASPETADAAPPLEDEAAEAAPVPEVEESAPPPREAPAPPPPLITPALPQRRKRAPIAEHIPPKRRFRLWRTVRRAVALLLIFTLAGPPVAVLAYRVVPPPITWLMVERLFQGQGLHKRWVSLGDIDPALPNAVIAAEDARFCEHHGFDFEAMQAAMRNNERHPGRIKGGSTISQQTAKNVFLWPGRDYVRKGLEAYFTVLIEAIWGKRRIMEIYLNVVEWGPGTYGAEAAANRYFGEPATDIDPGEAAHLAAILPSPLKWQAVNPGRYVQKRSSRIGAAAGAVRRDGLAGCLR
jgi:monofunctional biosynthetic peptidoglycan transglycosylase